MATKKLKFITKENLETFAKNLYIPNGFNLEMFELTRKSDITVNGISISTYTSRDIIIEGTDYDYDYDYDYDGRKVNTRPNSPSGRHTLYDEIGYVGYIKTNKNCLLLYLDEYGEETFLPCKANTEITISIDPYILRYTICLLGPYSENKNVIDKDDGWSANWGNDK